MGERCVGIAKLVVTAAAVLDRLHVEFAVVASVVLAFASVEMTVLVAGVAVAGTVSVGVEKRVAVGGLVVELIELVTIAAADVVS